MELLTMDTVNEVRSIMGVIIGEAYSLYNLYRNREKDHTAFAEFMLNLAHILEGIKQDVPEHAFPVLRELAAQVGVASTKLTKYAARGFVSTVWHLRSEQERMQSIMQGVQHLLPLLTVSVASASNVTSAVADLQKRALSLQGESAQAAEHLSHIRAAIEVLTASSATAAGVEDCLTTLRNSMLQLQEDTLQTVLQGCRELQRRVGQGLGEVCGAVEDLNSTVVSFSNEILASQQATHADVKEIKAYLMKLCGIPTATAKSIPPARVVEVLDELSDRSVPSGPSPEVPATNAAWASALRTAILAGKLTVSACLVLGVPFMPEGPLRPVTLACCEFIVSHAGSQRMLALGKCSLCNSPLADLEDDVATDNEAMAVAAAAENRGFAPRVVRSVDVTIGGVIRSGGEGTVVEGTLGGKAVAVKQVKVVAAAGQEELASAHARVKHVVAVSYIAAVASPYVCRLHGYCWTDSELWILMERCDGSLADFVPVAKKQCSLPGLPPLDVVTLGLMLCSALDAVHRGARCLHLDLTPSNVLLTPAGGTADEVAHPGLDLRMRSVRLSDFGLSKRLPSCVTSLVTGVKMGTPGYAPKEQLRGSGKRCSDIYSLGATLLFALTGSDPYPRARVDCILSQVLDGKPMKVPQYVEPTALKDLLSEMTAVDVESRPQLWEVRQALHDISRSLQADGAALRFITPLHHPCGNNCHGTTSHFDGNGRIDSTSTLPATPAAPGAAATVSTPHLAKALDAAARSPRPFLDRYKLYDSKHREFTDTAVMQRARGKTDGMEYEIKFFTSRAAYERERSISADRFLRGALPPVTEICSNEDAEVVADDGWVFPPFIITNRSESLGITTTAMAIIKAAMSSPKQRMSMGSHGHRPWPRYTLTVGISNDRYLFSIAR